MIRSCAFALALGVPIAAFAAAPDLTATILANMARQASAQTAFIEVSYRGMLDRPLVSSGTMKRLDDGELERDVEKPYQAVARIGGDQMSVQRGNGPVHTTPISRAPQVAAILSGFRALLGGNTAQLQQDFNISAQGDRDRWLLTLTPRTALLKQHVQSILIDGRKDQPRCLTLAEPDSDTTITLLGATANKGLPGSAPQQSALAAYCRNDR